MSILIKDATIITQNKEREILNADILIKENKIQEIKKNIKEKTEFTINAKNKIAIPGLINTHTHIAMTLFRGLGEGLELHDWLSKKIWPAEAKLTPKHVYNGTKLGILEMIKSGTTTYNEMYATGIIEIAKASEELGIRASLGYTTLDKVPGLDKEKELENLEQKTKELKEFSELIIPSVCCHAPYTCSKELILKTKEIADKQKMQFHMHISETRKELFDILKETGKRPFEYLEELGIIDSNCLFAHASWVSKREISIVGKHKATISSCPVSNLKLATGGICPVKEYDELNANVTLGTDGAASNNSLDMFETIKYASLLQKHKYWKASILPAQKFLDFATINGAKALKLNAGSLEAGKLADIVLLDQKMPNMVPKINLISNIVYSSNPSNVSDVIINGKIVLENKEFKEINQEKILENAQNSVDELIN